MTIPYSIVPTPVVTVELDTPGTIVMAEVDTAVPVVSVVIDKTGPQGFDGMSAYEAALEQGFKGSEEEWLKSFIPVKGLDYFTEAEQSNIVSTVIGAIGSTDISFEYKTVGPSDTWYITHNLGKYPSVTVVDSANTVVMGDVVYLTKNALVISFNGAFSGTAYLN